MSAKVKKIVYGLSCAGGVLVFGSLIYLVFFRPTASCFDEKLNQGEEDVDCGGPCASCVAEIVVKPVEVLDDVFFVLDNDGLVLSAEIYNPNREYGASAFSYSFVLRDREAQVLGLVSGSDYLRPLERRFVYGVESGILAKDIFSMDFVVGEVFWAPGSDFAESVVVLDGEPEVRIEEEEVRVAGTVRNNSASDVDEVKVIGVMRDDFGFKVFVSGATITQLRSFRSRDFELSLPYDLGLVQKIEEGSIEIYLYER